jgi:hypothetical protein
VGNDMVRDQRRHPDSHRNAFPGTRVELDVAMERDLLIQ